MNASKKFLRPVSRPALSRRIRVCERRSTVPSASVSSACQICCCTPRLCAENAQTLRRELPVVGPSRSFLPDDASVTGRSDRYRTVLPVQQQTGRVHTSPLPDSRRLQREAALPLPMHLPNPGHHGLDSAIGPGCHAHRNHFEEVVAQGLLACSILHTWLLSIAAALYKGQVSCLTGRRCPDPNTSSANTFAVCSARARTIKRGDKKKRDASSSEVELEVFKTVRRSLPGGFLRRRKDGCFEVFRRSG